MPIHGGEAITRSYFNKIKYVTNFALQTNDPFCVYYAINNLIQASPFSKVKHIISLEDFDAYKQEIKISNKKLYIRLLAPTEEDIMNNDIPAGTPYMYDKLVPWLQFIHLRVEYDGVINHTAKEEIINYAIPKNIQQPPSREHEYYLEQRMFIDINEKIHYAKSTQPFTKDPRFCIGTLVSISRENDLHSAPHIFAIICMYPQNDQGLSPKYLVMDSGFKHFYFFDEKQLRSYIFSHQIIWSITRVYQHGKDIHSKLRSNLVVIV